MLIDHMSQGLSFDSFGADVMATRATLYNWTHEHQEFLDAKNLGEVLSLKFWERLGVAGAAGKIPNFNVGAFVFNMKNKFGWRDKWDVSVQGQIGHEVKHTHEIDGAKLIDELKRILIDPVAERFPVLDLQQGDTYQSQTPGLLEQSMAHGQGATGLQGSGT